MTTPNETAEWTTADKACVNWSDDAGYHSASVEDPEVAAWLAEGNLPGPLPGLTREQLVTYAAAACFKREAGGLTVDGIPVATDRASQARITAAVVIAHLISPSSWTATWKTADGAFIEINAAQIMTIAEAVVGLVDRCFAVEASLVAAITASPPTVTLKAEIDAAFAAIQ